MKEDQMKKIAKELGSHGGLKTLQKYGPNHFRELQKKKYGSQEEEETDIERSD